MVLFDPQVRNALLLTGLGAAGTGLGGLLVVVQPKFSFRKLGLLQGCAAGLMLYISFFDLMPESIEAVGAVAANVCFFLGAAFFAVVVAFMPEPDSSNLVLDVAAEDGPPGAGAHASTGGETQHDVARVKGKPTADSTRNRSTRSAANTQSPPSPDKHAPRAGSVAAAKEAKKKVLLSGLITALGIAIHNAPEGMAVFLASIKSSSIGLRLAIAIALHNIPEGVAVALPVYFATGSRFRGFLYAFVSGLAEPAAVIVLALVMQAVTLDKTVIDCLLGAVGGIMAYLGLHELLPLAIEHAGKESAVLSLFAGMAIMSASLLWVAHWMGGAHGGHAH